MFGPVLNLVRIVVLNRYFVSVHEFRASGLPGKSYAPTFSLTIVVPGLAMSINESVDVSEPDVGHREFIPMLFSTMPFPTGNAGGPVEEFDAIVSAAKATLRSK